MATGNFKNQIVSFNTLLGHVADLREGVESVKNSGVPWFNMPMNKLRLMAEGDPEIAAYITQIEPVKKEFETFLLNNRALYESDRASADKILNENASPAQMLAVLPQIAKTSAIRLGATNAAVKRTLGKDVPDLLMPESQRLLSDFNIQVPGYGGSGKTPKVNITPDGSITIQ